MEQEQNSGYCEMPNTKTGIFLIKIPQYIAEHFEKAEDNAEVGKFCLEGTRVAPKISLVLADSISKDETGTIPKTYDMTMKDISLQSSVIFSKSTCTDADSVKFRQKRYAIEGKVMQRLECKPRQKKSHIIPTLSTINKRNYPVRQTALINEVVQMVMPLTNQRQNAKNEEMWKAESRNLKKDKEEVVKLLFRAFEKHQYYPFKALVQLTKQPVPYLKAILKEYCDYNMSPPNKFMWELKPEYRHYKTGK